MTGKRELVDIEVEIRAETDKAVQIFDGETTVWLPRSQIEIEKPRAGHHAPTIITLPEWLAQERGLM
jgi:hypothetical protein